MNSMGPQRGLSWNQKSKTNNLNPHSSTVVDATLNKDTKHSKNPQRFLTVHHLFLIVHGSFPKSVFLSVSLSHLTSDAPSIHLSSKEIKGNSVTLMCKADGNPSPTFRWHKSHKRISEGFNSTWNSSTLMVTPITDDDFTRYVCTAENRVGWDAHTFLLHKKGK